MILHEMFHEIKLCSTSFNMMQHGGQMNSACCNLAMLNNVELAMLHSFGQGFKVTSDLYLYSRSSIGVINMVG